jgi:hypothetical protein
MTLTTHIINLVAGATLGTAFSCLRSRRSWREMLLIFLAGAELSFNWTVDHAHEPEPLMLARLGFALTLAAWAAYDFIAILRIVRTRPPPQPRNVPEARRNGRHP